MTIRFNNGSIGVITYLACGDKLLNKERIELFGGGKSFVINDFRDAEAYADGKCRKIKKHGKGHEEEVQEFMNALRQGLPSPLPFESICYTTAATFKVIDALRTGLPQSVTIP